MEKSNLLSSKSNSVLRNMMLYLSGRFVSMFGTYIYEFAISLFILKTTKSAKLFSISLAIGILTRVGLSSIVGVISDKVNRKRIIVSADFVSGIVILGLFALSYIDTLKVSYIFATTFMLGICNVFFDVTIVASLPNIVDKDNLTRINSLNSSMQSIAQVLAPVIGGIIYVFVDIKLFLLINGISFILSGLTECFINFNFNKKSSDKKLENSSKKVSFSEQLKEGIDYLKSSKALFRIAILSIFINFFLQFGIVVPLPYIINNFLKLSENQYGIIQSMFAIGIFCGSVILSVLPQKEKIAGEIIGGLAVFSVLCSMLGFFVIPELFTFSKLSYFFIYSALNFMMAILLIIINVPLQVSMQKIIPDYIRGRVFGLITTISGGIAPLGMILSGVLIDSIPVFVLPLSSGILLLVITAIIFKDKLMREL